SDLSNAEAQTPKRQYKKEEEIVSLPSIDFSAYFQSIRATALDRATEATRRLRESRGWITDLYHHYLLLLLASMGRAAPAIDPPEPPPRRSQIPYHLHRAVRRCLPSVEIFAVRFALSAPIVKKEEKKGVKKLKIEKRIEVKKITVKPPKAPKKPVEASTPRDKETTAKTAEEISDNRDTVSKREAPPPMKRNEDNIPSPFPTPTDQSIGFREVGPSHRSVDTTYNKDEDTLNNIKSIDDDDLYTKRTESDTSIISDVPAVPEASFDFKKVNGNRVELCFQLNVRHNDLISYSFTAPTQASTSNQSIGSK
ncbi:hypothetical protein PFISCL1PPCAC_24443, partial [Pristionchus fissidentatus]